MSTLTETHPVTTGADRSGLQVIGLVMAGLTLSVALIASVVVYKTVSGGLLLDQNLSPQVGKTFVSRAG